MSKQYEGELYAETQGHGTMFHLSGKPTLVRGRVRKAPAQATYFEDGKKSSILIVIDEKQSVKVARDDLRVIDNLVSDMAAKVADGVEHPE